MMQFELVQELRAKTFKFRTKRVKTTPSSEFMNEVVVLWFDAKTQNRAHCKC